MAVKHEEKIPYQFSVLMPCAPIVTIYPRKVITSVANLFDVAKRLMYLMSVSRMTRRNCSFKFCGYGDGHENGNKCYL